MFNQLVSRRHALQTVACGFGNLALTGLAQQVSAASNPLAAKGTHHPARAKRMIFLFMAGGVSHVDSFDHKPLLDRHDGEMREFDDARTLAKTGKIVQHRVMKPLWKFRQHGESGRWASELFPHMAEHVDDLCVIRSMHTEGVAHGPATLFLHTGSTNLIRPSVGAWISYGLGAETQNLPAFVSICPAIANGGPRNFGSAFLPPVFQGTAIGRAGIPTKEAQVRNLSNDRLSLAEQRERFELIRTLNAEQISQHSGDSERQAVLDSFELGYRMQNYAPEVFDINQESKATLAMYGIDQKPTDDFGRQCLMARRLAESGVRYIQVNYADNSANPAWDQHSNMPKHGDHAKAVDQPVAALLADLKQRGLLEDTLVWWGGEFGRTPYAQQNGTGRDHNPGGFTIWLAGGGVKPGIAYGETDEWGHHAIQDKVHMHDLHATALHLLGMDHERLTHNYAGRNFRLTDVAGRVVHDILV